MEPADLRLDGMIFRLGSNTGIGGTHFEKGWLADGPPLANVSFADGSVMTLTSGTPPDTLKSLLLRDNGVTRRIE